MKRIKLILLLSVFFTQSYGQLISFDQLDTAYVFTSLEKALVNPSQVYRLDLTKSKLKEFPPQIKLMTNLNELVLDRNKIGVIPKDIQGLENLQRFSCSKCKLDRFISQICSLKNLVELDLSANGIRKIPDDIDQLEKLEKLILWENFIGYYPYSLMNLENLKVLDLLHNEMSHEEQRRIKDMLPNTQLHLSQPCDCEFYDDYDDIGEDEE